MEYTPASRRIYSSVFPLLLELVLPGGIYVCCWSEFVCFLFFLSVAAAVSDAATAATAAAVTVTVTCTVATAAAAAAAAAFVGGVELLVI